jgi:hypothetical protein
VMDVCCHFTNFCHNVTTCHHPTHFHHRLIAILSLLNLGCSTTFSPFSRFLLPTSSLAYYRTFPKTHNLQARFVA